MLSRRLEASFNGHGILESLDERIAELGKTESGILDRTPVLNVAWWCGSRLTLLTIGTPSSVVNTIRWDIRQWDRNVLPLVSHVGEIISAGNLSADAPFLHHIAAFSRDVSSRIPSPRHTIPENGRSQ